MAMSYYQREIVAILKCSPADAVEIEELMRNVIFHSTLDWQTKAQFRRGALEANEVLLEQRKERATGAAIEGGV